MHKLGQNIGMNSGGSKTIYNWTHRNREDYAEITGYQYMESFGLSISEKLKTRHNSHTISLEYNITKSSKLQECAPFEYFFWFLFIIIILFY